MSADISGPETKLCLQTKMVVDLYFLTCDLGASEKSRGSVGSKQPATKHDSSHIVSSYAFF